MPQCCNPSYSRSPPLTYLAQASRKQDVAINGNSQSPPHGLWPGTTSGSHIALEKQASECKCGSPDTSKLSISVLFHSKCPNLMFEPTGHEYFPLSTKKYYWSKSIRVSYWQNSTVAVLLQLCRKSHQRVTRSAGLLPWKSEYDKDLTSGSVAAPPYSQGLAVRHIPRKITTPALENLPLAPQISTLIKW